MGFAFKSCSSEALLVQQRSGWSHSEGRLRREECELPIDCLFSNWKILVGPSNWSGHEAGKDGIHRYHLHNLPGGPCVPGVYELGVTAPSWSLTSHRQRHRTLKREDVMAVYVGQSDNIRLRLQKYGQAGSHLEDSSLGSTDSGSKESWNGPRLFSEVFALGCSIAFRWAQTDNKVVVGQVESELLAIFDYAWNKCNNGNRRSGDILAKFFMPTKDSFRNHLFSGKKYLLCGTNAVGVKVAVRKPQDPSFKSNKNLGCFGTTLLQAPVVSVCRLVKVGSLELRCGVITDKGTPCNTPPVKGCKRCLQHKGMRVKRTPVAGSALVLQATKEFNVKQESVKVGGGSICLPSGFFERRRSKSEPVCTIESKPGCKTNILLHKQVSAIPKHRVRQIGCKYTPVPVDDSKRR